MASRVIEAGTVISRVQQLLSCGVLKERPLWLDVVESFPPITAPLHNRTPKPGRPLTLLYQHDRLIRDFQEQYEVTTYKGEPYRQRTTLSLFESGPGRHGTGLDVERALSLEERVVEEQVRLMAEGKSKEEALTAAIEQVSATVANVVIKQKTLHSEQTEEEMGHLEKEVMEIHKILSSK